MKIKICCFKQAIKLIRFVVYTQLKLQTKYKKSVYVQTIALRVYTYLAIRIDDFPNFRIAIYRVLLRPSYQSIKIDRLPKLDQKLARY